MIDQLHERQVIAWERIAMALERISDTAKEAYGQLWPAKGPARDAVITRIPTEEENKRKESGNTNIPVDQWLGEFENEEEEIGPRERAFLESKHDASSEAAPKAG